MGTIGIGKIWELCLKYLKFWKNYPYISEWVSKKQLIFEEKKVICQISSQTVLTPAIIWELFEKKSADRPNCHYSSVTFSILKLNIINGYDLFFTKSGDTVNLKEFGHIFTCNHACMSVHSRLAFRIPGKQFCSNILFTITIEKRIYSWNI